MDSARVQALPSHHPLWANPANDAGPLAADQQVRALTLVLTRAPEKEQAFQEFLAAQQNPASPDFHHWLTAPEIGARFGFSDSDIAAITGWLTAQGLRVDWVAPSNIFIGFGGAAADVNRAFQTELHRYRVNGKTLVSIASDPLIPSTLAPAIKTIDGLYTIDEQPLSRAVPALLDSPNMTSGSSHFLAPGDFNTIYDVPPAYTGAGVTIGIVGRSRVNTTDLTNFRSLTGISFPNPQEIVPPGATDPGISSGGDASEAMLDVQRAGSTAPGAQLLLVVNTALSGGIYTDAQYLVQTTPVPAQVMTISFGACESAAGLSGVSRWDSLFQQAAAEGVSVFVSSGDSGASGCDTAFTAPPISPSANSPNYICSSSYATCVGGTQFIDTASPTTYWNSSNSSGYKSARSYIPEGAWNEPGTNTSPQVAGTGGGVSSYIATPAWQSGITGVPGAAGRYTPDISFSSASHDGYLGCYTAGGGDCQSYIEIFAGTSAAAPGMAGVAALLDQKNGAAQGNLNPGIYAMISSAPAAFHDVTVATSGVSTCDVSVPSVCNNSVPGHSSQSGGQAGFAVGVGYDEATGLGSLDVANFIGSYVAPVSKTTPTVTVTPSSGSVTTAQGFSVTVTVSGGSGKPTPTGSVTLTSGSYSSGAVTLSSGGAIINIAAHTFSAGTAAFTAGYTPDSSSSSTYNSATGENTVTVTAPQLITPTVTVTPSAASITIADPLSVTITVGGGTGNPAPSGSVTLTSGSYTSAPATLASGSAVINIAAGALPQGSNTLTAAYTPDATASSTYNSATGNSTVTVTAVPLVTPTVTVTPARNSITTADSMSVTIAVSGGSGKPLPTGSVTLTSGSFSSAATPLTGGSATIIIAAHSLSVGTATLTAGYTPDSSSSTTYNSATGNSTVTVTAPLIAPSVGVTPSSNSITTADSLSVAVTVNGGTGNPTPTGSIRLTSGTYTSSAVTLVSGAAPIQVAAGALAAGTDTLTVTYTPDAAGSATYLTASGTATVTVTVPKIQPTVVAVPSASTISFTQPLSVAVTVSGGNGHPTPTGSVMLNGGGASAGPVALNSGTASINIPASSLQVGADTLSVSYSPDTAGAATYISASGTATVMVTAVPPVATTGAASGIYSTYVTLNGQDLPNGSDTHAWFLYGTSSTLSGATQTASQAIGSSTLNIPYTAGISGLTPGTTYYFQAVVQNSAGTSNGTIASFTTPGFTVAGAPVSVAKGGTGTSTVTVAPLGGFTGNVTLTATVNNSTGTQYPPTLGFGSTSPVSITSVSAGSATLTINTTAATTGAMSYPAPPGMRFAATGGAALACIFLLLAPVRRPRWFRMLGMLALFVAISGFASACGGSKGGGGNPGGSGISGTTSGTYTITITGTSTSASITASNTITLTVQ